MRFFSLTLIEEKDEIIFSEIGDGDYNRGFGFFEQKVSLLKLFYFDKYTNN